MKWVSAQEVIAFHDRVLAVLPGIKGMPEPQRAEAIIYRVQNQLYYEGVDTSSLYPGDTFLMMVISELHFSSRWFF